MQRRNQSYLRACTHVSVTRPQCLLMVLAHPLVGSAESIPTHLSWDQPRLAEPCARSVPSGFSQTQQCRTDVERDSELER